MKQERLQDELGAVLSAFAASTGLAVCVRPMGGGWADEHGDWVVPWAFREHRTPFCLSVKADRLDACKRCDVSDLPTVCVPGKGPFARACHAGAEEVLVPLWLEGALVGVVFLGQFRSTARQPGELRRAEAAEVEGWLALALPLQVYLLDLLRRLRLRRQLGSAPGGRRAEVEAFIDGRLREGVSLEALAGHLSLSPSRTSHVVRELTGRSLRGLVEDRRLAVAKDLLAGTEGKLAWVAAQAGFRDPAYFCRYFRKRVGTTPMAFRRLHRRHEGV